MRKINLILGVLLILLNLSISKADWVDKGQYFEMDSTYGEIKDFKISEDGKIWAVNNQNEILNFDFATGKLITRFKCEVDSNLKYKRISKDGTNTIYVSYIEPKYSNNIVNNRIQIFENITNDVVLDTIIKIDLISKGDISNLNFSDVDFSINNHLLLLNCNYNAEYFIGPSESGSAKFNKFLILDCQKNIKVIDLDLSVESYKINLNKQLEDFYFIGSGYSSSTNYSGDNSTSTNRNSFLKKYNKNENKLENLISFSYHSFYYHKGGEGSQSGNPSYFQQLLQPTNDSLLYLIFNNRLKSNDTILYTYDKFTNKYIDSIKINENTRYFTNYKLDNKDFVHIINDKTYKIKLINGTLITLDSLYFPENVYNNQFFNNGAQTFVFFTDNKSKLNYFTTENLKNIPNYGLIASKTLVSTKEKLRFISLTSYLGYTYEWEIEPNVIIKTNKNYLEYSYTKPGKFDVKLKIIDKDGKEYFFEKKKYITVLEKLKADFSYKFDKEYKDNCYFQSRSLGDPTSYDWDFGDGVKSNEKDPVHRYINNGDFKVRLIISDSISKDTTYQIVSYLNNYSYIDRSNNVIQKYLTGMPKKTQAVEVFNDKLSFLQYTIYKREIYIDFNDVGFEFLFQHVFFRVDKELQNTHNRNFPSSMYDDYFMNKESFYENYYLHLYDFLMVNDSTFIFKYNDYYNQIVKVLVGEEYSIPYNLLIEEEKQLKMCKYNEQLYYVNYFVDSTLTIDLKQIRKNATFKKQINFDKFIDNSYSLKYDTKHFSLISFKDYKHKYLIYNDNDTIFNLKEIKINKSIKVENCVQFDSDNILIYGKELFPEGNSIGTIIKLNTITNNIEVKSYRNCHNIKTIEKINDVSYLILPEVFGPHGYMILDQDLNIKIDHRDKNIPKPIEFLKFIKNNVYMIYQLPDSNNSINGAYEDNYTTYIVMDTLNDAITRISTKETNSNIALIFPNPSSDKISLDLGGVAVVDLVVYDILGNKIMSIPNYSNKSEIDISTIPIGTYTIQVQTFTGSISQRFVKY